MQEFNGDYRESLGNRTRCPVLVVELRWRNDAGVLYIPSHDFSSLPDSTYPHNARIAVGGVSASSQRIDVDTGASSIGSGSLTLVDKDATLSRALRQALDSGTDVRHAVATVMQGFSDINYPAYEPLWTMVVVDLTYQNGGYKIQLRDPTRFARQTIMTPQKGVVFAVADGTPTRFGFGCDSGRYPIDDIDKAVWRHPPDSVVFPGQRRKLIKFDDEIIAYSDFSPVNSNTTGQPSTQYGAWEFEGINPERAVLGSVQETHEISGSPDECGDFPEWEEIPYVNARPADLICYLFTGLPIDGSGQELPSHWHAGMDRAWLDLDSFAELQALLPNNYRLQKPPGETDALKWVQEQVLGPMGWQLITAADGRLTLRQAGSTNPDSAYVHDLGRCELSTGTTVTRRNSKLVTRLRINHGYIVGTQLYSLSDQELNPWAEEMFGQPDSETRVIELESLLPGSAATAIVNRLLNRHAQWWAQPQTVVKTVVKGSLHAIEVTDTARIQVKNALCPSPLRDYSMGEPDEIDRTFEIQSWQHNPINNTLSLTLVGGGWPVDTNPIGSGTTVPDSAIINNGDPWPLGAVLPTGQSTINPGVYWIDGDVTIPDAATLRLTAPGTLTLYYTGELTIYGTVDFSGQGAPAGSGGKIGRTQSTGGVDYSHVYKCQSHKEQDYTAFSHRRYVSRFSASRFGNINNLAGFAPSFENGAIQGVPNNLRGTGGPPGGDYRTNRTGGCSEPTTPFEVVVTGGIGGAGGGGLTTVGPSLAMGPNAKVRLNGEDGSAPTDGKAGAGGGGAPGGWLHVATSPASVVPIANYTEAIRGGSPDASERHRTQTQTSNSAELNRHSYYEGYPAANLASDHARVVYVA